MKTKFIAKILFLFACLLTFNTITFTQEKPQALKFDEFEDTVKIPFYAYGEITLAQRTERFITQLKKERAVRAYIIYYQARITEYSGEYEISYRTGKIKDEIRFKTNLEYEDVMIIDGGYREERTIEFWIVPKNADAPEPTPTLEKSETFACRKIYISNDTPLGGTETARFSIRADNFRGIDDYSLTWKVSVGEIVQGQGTSKIDVKLKDSAPKRVTAFVEVSGLPFPCPKVFSTTAQINRHYRK